MLTVKSGTLTVRSKSQPQRLQTRSKSCSSLPRTSSSRPINRAFTYYEMGYGSAMAWFMLLVIAIFTALIFRSSSAWVYYESEGK